MEPFISPKLALRMSSIFSRDKLMIPIVLSQSLWMFSGMACVHQQPEQSNYLELKVKLKLVNL